MQDRLKFRHWDKRINKMFYSERNDNFSYYVNNSDIIETTQCTGLKDKNGRLIYIGDVVKDVVTNSIYKVGEKKCAIYLENDEYIGYFHELSIAYFEKRLEVIGNIYENSELLKEES